VASHNEIDVVVAYSLKNDTALRTAVLIGHAYDEIKKVVIADFAKRIEKDLRKTLGDDWEIKNGFLKDDFLREKHVGIFVSKREWKNDGQTHYIGIQSQVRVLRNFIVGITKEREAKPTDQENQLKSKLGESCQQGNSSSWWVWYRNLERYASWDDAETLVQMRFETEGISEIILKQFDNLVRFAGKDIDAWYQKK
jgi:hypothetical protein